jgi:pimeloyl-ACP methyl ester carboxylesterase
VAGWIYLEREGVRLACLDVGGSGRPPALLLHGLAGHAGEWAQTAAWLTDRTRVLALDARGHGRSQRRPSDLSPAARVADVAFAIEELGLGPVVLVGQSLGGQTALLVAAERPDLVRALVVADASPAEEAEGTLAEVEEALAAWPVPFASRQAAVEFFGGPSLAAEMWADGLEQRDGGWWPTFDVEVMSRMLSEAAGPFWKQWEAIRCPTLVVRAGNGGMPAADMEAMAARLPQARLVELAGAAHDLHLDRPAEWRQALSEFLDGLGPPAPSR